MSWGMQILQSATVAKVAAAGQGVGQERKAEHQEEEAVSNGEESERQ